MSDTFIGAFDAAREGFSTDRVIADPDLRSRFVESCRALGIASNEEALCRHLLNLRKAGKLSKLKSRRTRFDDEAYRFASEIAVRHLERRLRTTLDDVLCSPTCVREFDAICESIAPGFSPLRYRWAALRLRKSRSIVPEILGHALPSTNVELHQCRDLNLDSVSTGGGLYLFVAKEETLYVGEAGNLRVRLKKHLDHSDNKQLARFLWSEGSDALWIEIHTLSSECPTKIRRALEVELIRSRKPTFNIIGKL